MKFKKQTVNYCEYHYSANHSLFSQDVCEGLSAENKFLPCRYIYDDEGSMLFCQIMAMPEYYLTDCEMEILKNYGSMIAQNFIDSAISMVELGAGDGVKTEILLRSMITHQIDLHYIPIDISEAAVHHLIEKLTAKYEDLYTAGLVSEYFHGLKYISQIEKRRKLILFLGSNIGNMTPDESLDFLIKLRDSLNSGDCLLIGFDLKKNFNILNRAYNDSHGITAKFNKNLLVRINRELGGTFDSDNFFYHSIYEPERGAIRSCLVSKKKQSVLIKDLNLSIFFDEYETIHTESSYKYTEDGISSLASKSGFEQLEIFPDPKHFFVDALWKCV